MSFRLPDGFDAGELPLPDGAPANGASLAFTTSTPTATLASQLAGPT